MRAMPVQLTFLITDLHRGGSPLLLAALAPGLARRRRFAPDVVSIAPLGEVAELLLEAGVPVTSLEARHNRDWTILSRFVRHLRERRPAVVCSWLIHANLLAAAAKPFTPPAVWVQSLQTLQDRPRWHWYLQGMLTPFADAFMAPAQAVVEKLRRFGPVPRPLVIPNGIDVPRFRDAAALPAVDRPWPPGAWVAGYVGRFDPVKRLPLLVRAVAELVGGMNGGAGGNSLRERLHLALVGYGPQEGELRALAASLGVADRVHLIPATRTPERWYKAMDAFCSPSAAEGFGLTLVEATVAGVPVVTCAAPAVRESLSGAVWLSTEPTAAEVAGALTYLFEGGRVMRPNADELEGRYAMEAMVGRVEGALWGLMGASR
jgi:glycosyltransferase involved in cell wall biosynthesis